MIEASPAQQQPTPEVLEYKGIVAAAREAEVAPRLDGLLSKINFTAGQVVTKGQAEAQLALAEVTLKNKQTLRSRNVGSGIELRETQAQRDIAAAKVDEARANAAIVETALQQMKLYAPISGIISRPLIKEGAYITKEARDQSRLATVVQLDPIDVIGQAPAAMYFQRGTTLKSLEEAAEQREFELVLPTGDKYPHKGRLVAGAYEFNPATQTTEITVEFPNPDYLLRPGLNVTLQSFVRAN
jgi:membrane fusion protein (multidrug efflux system)